jgi:hypothetical protein
MKTNREIRYENARSLATEGPAKFADKLDISPQQANAIIGPYPPKRNIGDNQARLIEETFGLEIGWLDHEHSSDENVGNSSIRGHFPLLSDEALALVACVVRCDELSGEFSKLFAAQQQTITFAAELSREQNRHTGRDDSGKWEFLTSWEREVEGSRNAKHRETAR